MPANVAGVWQWPQGELKLGQKFQVLEGALKLGERGAPMTNLRPHDDQISFGAGGAEYKGRVSGGNIEGSVKAAGKIVGWSATRRGD